MAAYIYSKISLTNDLYKSTTPIYRLLFWGPKESPKTVIQLLKPTTSLNGQVKIDPMVVRFREVLLYAYICVSIYTHIHNCRFNTVRLQPATHRTMMKECESTFGII